LKDIIVLNAATAMASQQKLHQVWLWFSAVRDARIASCLGRTLSSTLLCRLQMPHSECYCIVVAGVIVTSK